MQRNTTRRNRYRAIIAASKPACWICGQPINYQLPHLDPGEFVIDHKVALNAGGNDSLDNIAAAHRSCNRDKSDRNHGRVLRQVPGVEW